MTKNNNFIEEVESDFWVEEYYDFWNQEELDGAHLIQDIKKFIEKIVKKAQLKAREELKKEIMEIIEKEDMIEEGDYSAKYISIMLTDLISKIKNI